MQLYRVNFPGIEPQYEGTRVEAHKHAKKTFDKKAWYDVTIELVSFDIDKTSWISMMNDSVPSNLKVTNRWVLTDRGGLKEERVDD